MGALHGAHHSGALRGAEGSKGAAFAWWSLSAFSEVFSEKVAERAQSVNVFRESVCKHTRHEIRSVRT